VRSTGFRGRALGGWTALGLLLAASFWPVVAGKQSLLALQPGVLPGGPYGYSGPWPASAVWDPAASALKYVPFTKLASGMWHRGEVPFWNPFAGAGAPLLADPEAFATAPLRLPLYVSPSPAVWNAWYLGRLWLAGGLSFQLALWLGLSFFPALLGGAAYMLSGYLVLNLNLFHLDVDALLPGLLLALGALVRSPSRGRFAAAAVVAWAMCMGGNQQALVVDFLVAAAWVGVSLGSAPRGTRGRRCQLAAMALGAGAAGTLLHWLPLWELLGRSVSLHEAGSGRSGVAALGVAAMANLAGPWFGRASGDFYYAGLATLCMALVGAALAWLPGRGPARPYGRLLAAVAAFELAKVFGVPGLAALGSLPVLDMVWWVKYCAPLFLSLALLAALAADRLAGRRSAVAAGILILAAGELALGRPGPFPGRFDPLAPAPYTKWLKDRQAEEPWSRACGVGTAMMPMTASGFGIRDVGMEGSLIDREQYRFLFEGFSAPKPPRMRMFVVLERLDQRKLEVLRGLGVRHLVAARGWSPPAACSGSLRKAYDAEVTIYRVEGSRPFAGFPERGRREFHLGLVLSVLLGGGTLAAGLAASRARLSGRGRMKP